MSIIGIAFSLVACSFLGIATLYPYHVDEPSAINGIADYGGSSRWTDVGCKVISDGYTSLLYGTSNSVWVATGGNFTINPWVWPTIPDMPLNASILYVELIVTLKLPSSTAVYFNMQYATDATYDDVWNETADWHGPANGTFIYGPITYWASKHINITDESVGGPNGGWTPTMLKSNLTWVRMFIASPPHYADGLLIDYIGLTYVWQYEYFGGWLDEEPDDTFSTYGITPVTILGTIGFIGMIAVPCVAVLASRQNGGSRIYLGVMALAAFTFCFGIFYASINGG